MGVIMTAVIGYYDISNVERRTKITEDKFKVINTALVSYLARNGRLPCPAPLDCDLEGCNNDNIYDEKILGLEFRKDKDIDKECISDNNGVFESKNDVGEKLLYGNVPALSLGLDNNYLIDDWGNKLVYIVPDILTQENALKDILINQNTETRDPTISDEYVKDGEIFLLLSSNTNTQGAYAFDNRQNNVFSREIQQTIFNEDGTTTTITKEVNNLPEKDFKVDLNDEKYLKYHRNIDNIHDAFNAGNGGGGVENPDCPPIELDYNIKVDNRECQTFVFKKVGTYRNNKEPWFNGSSIGKVYEYIIPEDADQIKIELWGAGGGHSEGDTIKDIKYNSKGGKGGYTYATFMVTDENLQKLGILESRTIYLYPGEKGNNSTSIIEGEIDEDGVLIEVGNGAAAWNGGGCGKKEASGGGASDIRTVKGAWNDDASLNSRILVAGGGGGSSAGKDTSTEDGGDGGGGNSNGESAKGSKYVQSLFALGGGQTYTKKGSSVTCKSKGGGTWRGGGGYYAGGSTVCSSYSSNFNNLRKGCGLAADYPSINITCGGGGGGSGYIKPNIFNTSGGRNGIRRSHGKIRICVISKDETIVHTMKFPRAKYGELSFADTICPYNIVSPAKNANIADYYTLSTFRAADGSIIDNRPAIRCGIGGQWETNSDGIIKMIYECKELNKCKQPFTVNNDVDWGDYDFEVTNTAIVEDITGKNRMQCMVDKAGNANWYKIK